MYSALKNWGRWGPDDQRGTLNHLTAKETAVASGLVRTGQTISLSHSLRTDPSPDNPHPVHHHMLTAGDARHNTGIAGYEAARDYIGLDIHGMLTTHVDALAHMFVNGEMFGGRPAGDVRSDGAQFNTIMSMAEGVVGRGVLLDVPLATGTEYLDAGAVVSVEDLEMAERRAGLAIGRGDILLVRWGRGPRLAAKGAFDGFSGLHPDALPWLQRREVAVLGSDGISDPVPFLGTPGWPFPVHQIGITAMGLHLVDNMALDALAAICAAEGRWEFLFMMAPLRITHGTGCPVNPIAVM
jgi:kynurenine formamidase